MENILKIVIDKMPVWIEGWLKNLNKFCNRIVIETQNKIFIYQVRILKKWEGFYLYYDSIMKLFLAFQLFGNLLLLSSRLAPLTH